MGKTFRRNDDDDARTKRGRMKASNDNRGKADKHAETPDRPGRKQGLNPMPKPGGRMPKQRGRRAA